MAEGIRLVSVRQGIDPRKHALVPLGGAGGIHATALARELGITRIIVPRIPGVLAAAGLLAAPTEHEVSADFGILTNRLDRAELQAKLDGLDAQASVLMRAEKAAPNEVTVSYYADLCYVGQSYNLEIPLRLEEQDIGQRLYRDFLEAHDRVYGHSVENPVRIVALRAVHRAGGSETIEEMRFAPTDEPVELGRREIVVAGEGGPVEATVYRREAMPEGFSFSGPSIVQQSDTTTLIEPGWNGVVDPAGNLILTREGA
jgi:N-methylhydantoinase A